MTPPPAGQFSAMKERQEKTSKEGWAVAAPMPISPFPLKAWPVTLTA
jgi:hypothetical protein